MTFFVDPDLETEIMKNIVKDVKALATNEPNITENKVIYPSFIRSLFQYFFRIGLLLSTKCNALTIVGLKNQQNFY